MNDLCPGLESRLAALPDWMRAGELAEPFLRWQVETVPADARARLLARVIAGAGLSHSDAQWALREGARRLHGALSFAELAERLSTKGRIVGGETRRQLVTLNAVAARRDLARALAPELPVAPAEEGAAPEAAGPEPDPFALFDEEEERERQRLAELLQQDKPAKSADREKLVRRALKRIREQAELELAQPQEERTRTRLETLAGELRQVAEATALQKPQLPLLVAELMSEQKLVSAYTWRPFVRDWVSQPQNRLVLQRALASLFAGGDPASRISEFDALMPEAALTPDQGQRASLASLFLFGGYGPQTPVFRPAQARRAYHAFGEQAPKRGTSAEERYRFYLDFLDRLLELARENGLPLTDRLDAAVAASWLAER